MANVRPDWSWQPDEVTQKAIMSGRAKIRRAGRSTTETENDMATKKKATKKKVAAKKGAPKKKLDGKKLAAQRKPRDTAATFIRDELAAGKSDVAKIIERTKAEFPKSKATPGYVRFLAKGMGLSKQVAYEVKAETPAKTKAKKAKKAEEKADAPAVDPAS